MMLGDSTRTDTVEVHTSPVAAAGPENGLGQDADRSASEHSRDLVVY
jgi:hypothetical protein